MDFSVYLRERFPKSINQNLVGKHKSRRLLSLHNSEFELGGHVDEGKRLHGTPPKGPPPCQADFGAHFNIVVNVKMQFFESLKFLGFLGVEGIWCTGLGLARPRQS